MDLKHSNEKNVCIIYGQQASKVPLPSHLMPFCFFFLLLCSISRELPQLAEEIHIIKTIWTSLNFVNSAYLLLLITFVLGERSEDGSYNHIQFEKRRLHLVWIPRSGEACLLVRNSSACKGKIELSYSSDPRFLSFYMVYGFT